MSKLALQVLQEAAGSVEEIKGVAPAIDEILLFALERRYLGVDAFRNIILEQHEELSKEDLRDHFSSRVRLLKITEICFTREETFHLAGVESILTSMRDTGHSLLFLVCGQPHQTQVFVGLSEYDEESSLDLASAVDGYRAAWEGHFPGSQMQMVSDKEMLDISSQIGQSSACGVLTGIPSLKRQEETGIFVQGLERLIRVMRGRTYSWLSIADPISLSQINVSLDACRKLTDDVHPLVKRTFTSGRTKGKNVTTGMFGMLGQSATEGSSMAETLSNSQTVSENITDGTSAQYLGEGSGALLGGTIGSVVCPGLGTAIGAGLGTLVGFCSRYLAGGYSGTFGAMMSGTSHSATTGNAFTTAQAFTTTASNAIARQVAGGGFGSLGYSWTRSSQLTSELFNAKADWCVKLLNQHEQRLQEGAALGMWNVANYLCTEENESFVLGQGVLRSLFSGMDSHFEPPRVVRLPREVSQQVLRRFANLYISFPNDGLRELFDDSKLPDSKLVVATHPFGMWYNGLATPVTTKELAIVTPLAKQDVEGITVTERAAFGVNTQLGEDSDITVGQVQDHGLDTNQKIRLPLSSLPKHMGIFGLTGSGKTNTVCHLLEQLWKRHGVPFLVIEPAKAEYRNLARDSALGDDLVVLSAGVERSEASPLRINPFYFDPGADVDGRRVHVLTHIDRLKATFNASFPMYASMPYILEEAILEVYRERGWDLGNSSNRHVDIYSEDFSEFVPTILDLYHKVKGVVDRKGYWVEQRMNIEAALKARLSSLMVGSKGSMFNCLRSLPSAALFDRPMIIELKHMGDDDEKAFLMGLLISKLYEYRESTKGQNKGKKGLQHVLVIEEAHRLLKNVGEGSQNLETANASAKSVTTFVDMLSEIRALGQGVVVVDQVPSRLNSNVIKGTSTKIVHRLMAEDDRQMVGKCMGLNEEQILDLALLETGQCVVHHGNQRQAAMCKVPLNAAHEAEGGGGLGEAVGQFKSEYQSVLNPLRLGTDEVDDIDREDRNFCEQLHRAMLAAVFVSSRQTSNALATLLPRRFADKGEPWPVGGRRSWLSGYWTQIANEIWAYYSGDFADCLQLKKQGLELLFAWEAVSDLDVPLRDFKHAAQQYLGNRPNLPGGIGGGAVAIIYDQLIMRDQVTVRIRNSMNENKHPELAQLERLGLAIWQQIRRLLPRKPFIAEGLFELMLDAVLNRFELEEAIEIKLRKMVIELEMART